MTAKVIDASAFAAIIFQEREEEAARKRLAGFDLYAPTLLRFEIANVCTKKLRTNPDMRESMLLMHSRSLEIPIQLLEVSQIEVVELAEQLKLSAYDASYLWLARQLGVELVTLDEKLQRAAAKP